MGRLGSYLVDFARIRRTDPYINMGVVSNHSQNQAKQPYGDWIPARLQPVDGSEVRQEGQVKLAYQYQVILDREDLSGNEVFVVESDELEMKVSRYGGQPTTEEDEIVSDPIERLKIVGPIQEIRKRTRIQSYVVPVAFEDEY